MKPYRVKKEFRPKNAVVPILWSDDTEEEKAEKRKGPCFAIPNEIDLELHVLRDETGGPVGLIYYSPIEKEFYIVHQNKENMKTVRTTTSSLVWDRLKEIDWMVHDIPYLTVPAWIREAEEFLSTKIESFGCLFIVPLSVIFRGHKSGDAPLENSDLIHQYEKSAWLFRTMLEKGGSVRDFRISWFKINSESYSTIPLSWISETLRGKWTIFGDKFLLSREESWHFDLSQKVGVVLAEGNLSSNFFGERNLLEPSLIFF